MRSLRKQLAYLSVVTIFIAAAGNALAVVVHDEPLDGAAAALEPEFRGPAGRHVGGRTAPLRRGRHAPHVTIQPCLRPPRPSPSTRAR